MYRYMDNIQRLKLQDMLKQDDVIETTDLIREVKHSKTIRADIKTFTELHKKAIKSNRNSMIFKLNKI